MPRTSRLKQDLYLLPPFLHFIYEIQDDPNSRVRSCEKKYAIQKCSRRTAGHSSLLSGVHATRYLFKHFFADSLIILYVFLGILGGIALIICLYKLSQTFSGEIKPKNKFGKNFVYPRSISRCLEILKDLIPTTHMLKSILIMNS